MFGSSLEDDLTRRDFTVNSLALRLPKLELVDPSGGVEDLVAGLLRTPAPPEQSFGDDPLRMLRAARFASQLGFEVDDSTRLAMDDLAPAIERISAERVRDELSKLLLTDAPRRGIRLLVESGLAALVLPELPALRLERDEHHRHKDVYEHTLTVLEQTIELEQRLPGAQPDFVARFAALMHDVGKPRTRRFVGDGTVTFHHHDVVGAKLTRKRMPGTGSAASSSFDSSSCTRSMLMMPMVSARLRMASTVSSVTVKPSCAAKRAARSMRSGSSPNEIAGVDGVVRRRASRSSIPPEGSTSTCPGSRKAMALTVKSRRVRSASSEVPKATSGLRLAPSYWSER